MLSQRFSRSRFVESTGEKVEISFASTNEQAEGTVRTEEHCCRFDHSQGSIRKLPIVLFAFSRII